MSWNAALRPHDVVAVIMGGGAGTRLFPLTKDRAKPAVPLAGKYRLIDIPISNCINSDLRRIFVLTQFNSGSLHRHIQETYKFDTFSPGFVEILAAQQTHRQHRLVPGHRRRGPAEPRCTSTPTATGSCSSSRATSSTAWTTRHARAARDDRCRGHRRHDARCGRERPAGFGIMQVATDGRITRFVEKPTRPRPVAGRRCADYPDRAPRVHGHLRVRPRDVLADALAARGGLRQAVIPRLIETRRVFAYLHEGYWEDIGTIRAFYEANLDLCEPLPQFNFYDASAPIFTHARYLPATKIIKSQIERSVIADGCIINDAHHRALR